MKAVILAGGLGSRLKPFTEVIPKPLLPIGEKSVLEIQIERLKNCGFNEIYLATNYKSEYIEKFFGDGSRYGVNLKISKEDIPLGTVGPLTLLRDQLTEPFLVMNGDILTLLDFGKMYEFALTKDSLMTIGIKELITPFQFGNIFFDGDYVTGIQEKPDIKTNVIAGVYIFQPELIDFIPKNVKYSMDSLINDMLSKELHITKYTIYNYWLDIGQVDDYQKAQEIYQEIFSESRK